MRRTIAFTLMSVACAVALAATVYKWVDENGVVHYSDQPHENAEKVHLAAPQTYTPSRQAQQPANSPAPAQASNTYQSCNLVAPTPDQNFPNTDSVPTASQISPPPHDGDQAKLFVDGILQSNYPATGGSYTISPVYRGAHSVQLVVEDSSGKVLCQSSSVSFSVTQPSVLNPANPNLKH